MMSSPLEAGWEFEISQDESLGDRTDLGWLPGSIERSLPRKCCGDSSLKGSNDKRRMAFPSVSQETLAVYDLARQSQGIWLFFFLTLKKNFFFQSYITFLNLGELVRIKQLEIKWKPGN